MYPDYTGHVLGIADLTTQLASPRQPSLPGSSQGEKDSNANPPQGEQHSDANTLTLQRVEEDIAEVSESEQQQRQQQQGEKDSDANPPEGEKQSDANTQQAIDLTLQV